MVNFKTGFWILWMSVLTWSCKSNQAMTFHKLQGMTMGTTWHITYESSENQSVNKDQLDSLLLRINQAASTYIPSSIISRLNRGETLNVADEPSDEVDFFRYNVSIADQVWQRSGGYFDPTVMELVNYWGFGYEGHRPVESVDSSLIDSLLQYVGFEGISERFKSDTWILPRGFQLDFSAVAKGAACDWLGRYFEKNDITNYLVEIGGEMLVRGPGREGQGWIVGVSKPQMNAPAQELIEELAIRDQAVATSGNYRNYYESHGQMFTHTINPKTGYSEKRNILSATVITDHCGTADALATSMMAMGMDGSKKMLKQLSNVEAYLVYNNGADSMLIYETPGMKTIKYNTKP